MPIFSRNLLRSVVRACTSVPSTTMRPLWIGSSPFTHISSVDLPEPDPPMTDTTSPFATVIETRFRTSSDPKDLWTFSISIEVPPLRLEPAPQAGDRIAQHEVDQPADGQYQQRLLDAGDDHLRRPQEFDHADPPHERRVLHDAERKADPGRQRNTERDGKDDFAQVLPVGETERAPRAPRGLRHRLHAGPHG